MRKTINLSLMIAAAILLFSDVTKAQTNVGGAINSNTTWSPAGSPYIVQSNIAVMTGATLTIDAGVTVKFTSQTSMQFFGTLRAVGTQSQPIIFTSNLSTPAAGDWGYILFNDASPDYDFGTGAGCIMKYCVVEYAGGASVTRNGAVRMNNAFPYFNNCTIQHNAMTAIKAWNLSSTLHIDSSSIQYNNVDTGAVFASGGGLAMNGCNVSNNSTSIDTSNNYNNYSVAGVFTKDASTKIKNCTFNSNNSCAIDVCKIAQNTQTDSIVNNTITNNAKHGIYYLLLRSTYGLSISSKINILNNDIMSNYGNGVYLYEGNSSLGKVLLLSIFTIKYNKIADNSKNGICICFSSESRLNNYDISDNVIFYNHYNGIDCKIGTINVADSSVVIISNNISNNNSENGILFGGNGYGPMSNLYLITNNTVNNNLKNGFEFYGWNQYHSNDTCIVTNNTFYNNRSSGIYFFLNTYHANPTPYAPFNLPNIYKVRKNKIIGNKGPQGGLLIKSTHMSIDDFIIEQNIFADNYSSSQGCGVYMDFHDTSNVFRNNAIINNTASTTPALYYKGTGKLQADKNTIVYNKTTGTDSLRMVYLKQTQSFTHNNIYNSACSSPILLWYDDYNGNTLDAQNCFWRKNTSSGIDSLVWDYFDDQNIAIVDHSNFQTSPDTAAPVTPVENVIKTDLGGGNIKLTWSPNAETDLAGYKVYWGSPTGYSFANAVNVGNVLTYTISGISITDTVAVTAYDTQADGTDDQVEGHESWFSGNYSSPFPTIIQNGGTLSCYPAFSTYQWYDSTGPVSNATQQQFTPAVSGIYYVIVTDNGCTSATIPYDFIIESIYSTDKNASVSIFPNPANNNLTINFPAFKPQNKTTLELFNINGRLLKSQSIVQSKMQTDISEFTAGVYVIRIMDDDGVIVERFVKE